MGSVCCCFNVADDGENAAASNRNHRDCFQTLIHKCGAIFRRGQTNSGTSANQGLPSSTSVVARISSVSTNRSQDRGLPNSADPRHPQVQQGVVSRRQNKVSSHSRIEPEPVGHSDDEVTQKLLTGDKLRERNCEGGSNDCCCESPEQDFSSKVYNGVQYPVLSSEEEDVCPTCLEEYTPENPKISTKCSHHYHLSCIYEWQERSETCPMCGKLMEFEESN